jgi:hypothetical protein
MWVELGQLRQHCAGCTDGQGREANDVGRECDALELGLAAEPRLLRPLGLVDGFVA